VYLRLNYQSGEAIYRQIVEQVKYKVASGELSPGQRLPSIRELAKQLKINPRTVVKSYEELRAAGLAVMRQGQGVFITENQTLASVKTRQKSIADMTRRMFSEAMRIGADKQEILRIVNETAQEMRESNE